MDINGRINLIIEKRFQGNKSKFAKSIDVPPTTINNIVGARKSEPTANLIEKIVNSIEGISAYWLVTGFGEPDETNMKEMKDKNENTAKIIPFFEDTTLSVGGREMDANVEPVTQPSGYINTGDWFNDATAALRHTGHSMTQYPKGCILALKEVIDRDLIIPGRDYVIETTEYRVTKQVQLIKEGFITCYSTNEEKYIDGRLIHPPFDIKMSKITHIYLVLGYVVNENGSMIIRSNKR